MTEDEVYQVDTEDFKEYARGVYVLLRIFAILVAGIVLVSIALEIWFVTSNDPRLMLNTLVAMVLSLILVVILWGTKSVHEMLRRLVTKPVTLKEDALILDDATVPLRDIESAEFEFFVMWPDLEPRVAERGMFQDLFGPARLGGPEWVEAVPKPKAIRLKHSRGEHYVQLSPTKRGLTYDAFYEYNNQFMDSLAEHMEKTGIRLEKKMSQVFKKTTKDKTRIFKIINLDVQKRH